MPTNVYYPLITVSGGPGSGPAVVGTGDGWWYHEEFGEIPLYSTTSAAGIVFKVGTASSTSVMFATNASGIFETPDPIPAGSLIQEAVYRIVEAGTTTDGGTTLELFIPSPDHRWEFLHPLTSGIVNRAEVSFDMDVYVDEGGARLVQTLPGGNLGGNAVSGLRSVEDSGPNGLGQGFVIPTGTSGTLDYISIHARNNGASSGNVWMEIYDPVDPDISTQFNGLPFHDRDFPDTSSLLSTSDLRSPGGSGFAGARISFTFSGADKIFLDEEVKYVAMLRGDFPYSKVNNQVWFHAGHSINFFGIVVLLGDYWDTASACAQSSLLQGGFNDTMYSTQSSGPYRAGFDGAALKTTSSGSILNYTVKDLAQGETFDFDVTTQVQELISSVGYQEEVSICIVMGPAFGTTQDGDIREIYSRGDPDDSRQQTLTVSYRSPEDRRFQIVD